MTTNSQTTSQPAPFAGLSRKAVLVTVGWYAFAFCVTFAAGLLYQYAATEIFTSLMWREPNNDQVFVVFVLLVIMLAGNSSWLGTLGRVLAVSAFYGLVSRHGIGATQCGSPGAALEFCASLAPQPALALPVAFLLAVLTAFELRKARKNFHGMFGV